MVKQTQTILRQNWRNYLSVFVHFMGLVSKELTVIMKLNPNKAYGFDRISIHTFQICHKGLCKPLYFIFLPGIFPTEWETANMVPIHKQDEKQNVKNNQPVSFLPIFVNT